MFVRVSVLRPVADVTDDTVPELVSEAHEERLELMILLGEGLLLPVTPPGEGVPVGHPVEDLEGEGEPLEEGVPETHEDEDGEPLGDRDTLSDSDAEGERDEDEHAEREADDVLHALLRVERDTEGEALEHADAQKEGEMVNEVDPVERRVEVALNDGGVEVEGERVVVMLGVDEMELVVLLVEERESVTLTHDVRLPHALVEGELLTLEDPLAELKRLLVFTPERVGCGPLPVTVELTDELGHCDVECEADDVKQGLWDLLVHTLELAHAVALAVPQNVAETEWDREGVEHTVAEPLGHVDGDVESVAAAAVRVVELEAL